MNTSNYLDFEGLQYYDSKIKEYVGEKTTADTYPVEDSANLITSGGVYEAIDDVVGDINSILTNLLSGNGV